MESNASATATAAPVIAAVRVPPSACSTSQSTRSVCSPKRKLSSIARMLRPMSRWISCVRPPSCARSRGVRVRVARGSIAYSAVIHPSPRPLRHPGTPGSMLAVHSTRVLPNETRQLPSAYSATPRSSESGRSASLGRPPRAAATVSAGTKLLDDGSGGLSRREWDHDDVAAAGEHLGRSDYRRFRVVAALHDDVGREKLDELEGRVLLEHDDGVDGLERGEHVGALGLAAHRTARPLQAPNGCVAVQPDDERVTGAACAHEHVDVTRMQQVEDAVREHDAP